MLRISKASVVFCLLATLTMLLSFKKDEKFASSYFAKVVFQSAVLDGDTLNKYRSLPNFQQFVFQPMQNNAERWNDIYILMCYAVMSDKVIAIPLHHTQKYTYKVDKKLILSQFTLNKEALQKFYGSSQSSIMLIPTEYKTVKHHIKYRVTEVSNSFMPITPKTFQDFYLDPSPPALIFATDSSN
ncbi:MAG: hypothetical protein JWQ96_1451 [Segetibacter sp.]|nr:hypothetical protein [Segetibacter sp.]